LLRGLSFKKSVKFLFTPLLYSTQEELFILVQNDEIENTFRFWLFWVGWHKTPFFFALFKNGLSHSAEQGKR